MNKKDHHAPIKKIPFWLSIGLGEEKEYFIENLALLIESGMGIAAALDTIERDLRSAR